MENGIKSGRGMTLSGAVHLAAPHTWPAAVLPALLGSALACADGALLRPWIALTVLAVGVLLQSAINTLNDYRDFVSGLDSAENCADPTDAALIYDGCTPRGALALGLTLLLCAAILGGILVVRCTLALLIYGALALLAIVLYVLPKRAFSALPFGELLSGLAMGLVLTAAAFHAQCGRFSPALLWQSLPPVLTIGCIMLVNNTSDIEKDTLGGRRTLPVCLGRSASEKLLRTLLAVAALGVTAILLFRFPGGAAAAAVMFFGLLTDANVRGLFLQPVTPERRRDSMGGILAAHKWISTCYLAGVVIFALAN